LGRLTWCTAELAHKNKVERQSQLEHGGVKWKGGKLARRGHWVAKPLAWMIGRRRPLPTSLPAAAPMARRTGEKDGGQRASAQVSTKNRSGVTAVRESRRRSSVACLRGHRPASGDAGVDADTTSGDPDGEHGIEHNRDGERGSGSKAQTHTRVARGVNRNSEKQGGRHPHATRGQRRPTLCAATTSGDRA
jgi:hypothetical protein